MKTRRVSVVLIVVLLTFSFHTWAAASLATPRGKSRYTGLLNGSVSNQPISTLTWTCDHLLPTVKFSADLPVEVMSSWGRLCRVSTWSLLSSFGLWMRRRRPWPSMESFSRVSRWRLEDLTTIGLYLVSQSSPLSTSQVCHRAAPRKRTLFYMIQKVFSLLVVSVGVVSTVVPDSPHKLFIGGLPNYLNDDQVFNWEHTHQVHSCFLSHLLRFLSHLECAQNMFYISLWQNQKVCCVREKTEIRARNRTWPRSINTENNKVNKNTI